MPLPCSSRRPRLREDAQRLVEALRELGEGRYAALFDPKGVLLESPADAAAAVGVELVQTRAAALFGSRPPCGARRRWATSSRTGAGDEFFLAFLNGRVGVLVACPDAKRLEDESGKLLRSLADRLLRLNPAWRLDEKGRGLFFGSPRLDTVVISRAERLD